MGVRPAPRTSTGTNDSRGGRQLLGRPPSGLTFVGVLVPEEDLVRASEMAERLGVTVSEAFRRSLATQAFLDAHLKPGTRLVMYGSDGAPQEIILRRTGQEVVAVTPLKASRGRRRR